MAGVIIALGTNASSARRYEIKHPETRQGGDRGNQHTGGRQTEKISFSQDAAAKIGKTERAVRNSVRIGERLTPEAEIEAKKLGLDDQLIK